MKTVKKEMKARKMDKQAMKKTKGGSTVSALIFSNFGTKNNPEPKQGPNSILTMPN